MLIRSRSLLAACLFSLTLFFIWFNRTPDTFDTEGHYHGGHVKDSEWKSENEETYLWKAVTTHYPVATFRALPTEAPVSYPKVQAEFPDLSRSRQEMHKQRREAVKEVFTRCWNSYRKNAWMSDELSPVSGGRRNPFGGWAATLVDALDTLWIMGMNDEFEDAVKAAEGIDFTKTELKEVNIFETTIRYLGGFLAAFELSNDKRLLRKAVEVGEMIYKAFDTPNRMPITRWNFQAALKGEKQTAGSGVLVAEIGSLSMELTRLSQLTGDAKWFDASQRIMELLEVQQDSTYLPGQWPLVADAKSQIFNGGNIFTLGAMADSVYEYLPKMAALLGGQLSMYQSMYEKAMDAALKHNLFRPMIPASDDILISGQVHASKADDGMHYELETQGQHLVCFLGGMLALGGRLFSREQDVEAAVRLTAGCIYTYKVFPHGIMPETFYMVPCKTKDINDTCAWDENEWKQEILARKHSKGAATVPVESIIAKDHLPAGFTEIPDKRYILRPEAIESVFVMYRVTAHEEYADHAWTMFTAIEDATKTELANTAIWDVTVKEEKPQAADSMESFWMGETLKYFYLIFSDPELISLDEFVFNTEAHPLRRLVE